VEALFFSLLSVFFTPVCLAAKTENKKKMIKEEKIQVFQIKGFDFYKLLNGKGRS
jgi:hypothetical protein